MIEGLREKGPVVVVDAGNLYWGRAVLRPQERDQQLEKARLLAQAYALAGVDAMVPGAGDLAFGLPTVLELASEHTLPYVAANLECGGSAPFPAYRHFERGGRSLTVVGVLGTTQTEPTCRVTDAVQAVRAAVEAAPADIVLVLSGQTVQADEALVAAVPALSLVVNGQARQELPQPRSLSNGGLFLAAGSRGKKLGVMAVTFTPGASVWHDMQRLTDANAAVTPAALEGGPAHQVTNTLVELGTELADHPATAALVARAKAAIAASEPVAAVSAVATGPFAGSSACTGCHADQAKQWGGTAHSQAYASLVKGNSQRDRACFSCHVTGAHHPDGPTDPGAVAGLESVGCEACHGPGKAHIGNPTSVEMVAKPGVDRCTDCHDGKQDEGRFDPATYLPQVMH